ARVWNHGIDDVGIGGDWDCRSPGRISIESSQELTPKLRKWMGQDTKAIRQRGSPALTLIAAVHHDGAIRTIRAEKCVAQARFGSEKDSEVALPIDCRGITSRKLSRSVRPGPGVEGWRVPRRNFRALRCFRNALPRSLRKRGYRRRAHCLPDHPAVFRWPGFRGALSRNPIGRVDKSRVVQCLDGCRP